MIWAFLRLFGKRARTVNSRGVVLFGMYYVFTGEVRDGDVIEEG